MRSRFSRNPIVVNGAPKVAYITDHDIKIFELLIRYRYLSTAYIHGLIGGNLTALRDRLDLLDAHPNNFIHMPIPARNNAHFNRRSLIWELDRRGFYELKIRGLPHTRYHATPFGHEMMVCQIAASIEIARRTNPNLSFIPFDLKPIELRINGKKGSIVSDYHPFVLGKEGSRKFYFGFEADTGSENGETVIRGKFEKYLRIIEDKMQKELFGVRTFYLPFVTSSPIIERNRMDLLMQMTRGKGSEHIFFKHIPLFYSDNMPASPTDHIVTEPWRRAGYPDFYMNQ